MTEILSKIAEDDTPFEFEFFTGGKNQKLEVHVNGFGLSTDNLQFLNFLQSDICEQILLTNKLKIHIETGNIYHDNKDTNESIFDFFLTQQISINRVINYNFSYDESYDKYFSCLVNGFESYQESKLYVMAFKNSKFIPKANLLMDTVMNITIVKKT